MAPKAIFPQKTGEAIPILDKAKALALILREEFGCPFAFFDGSTGNMLSKEPASLNATPPAGLLQPAQLLELAAEGQTCVQSAGEGLFRLILVIQLPSCPCLIACGIIPALAPSDRDLGREQARLKRWGQAVADRLRLSDELGARFREESKQPLTTSLSTSSLPLLDSVIRSLRIHQEPSQQKERILEAALNAGCFQTLLWVPLDARDPAILKGKECLTQPDCLRLIHALSSEANCRPGQPFICNTVGTTVWGQAFPRITNLLAMSVADPGIVGWVLALNKRERAEPNGALSAQWGSDSGKSIALIGLSDIDLVSPFVALLELHIRSFSRYQDVKELLVGLTKSLTAALDAKDSYTYGHSERVARITVELGRELGFSADDLSELYLMGLLHDVGNLGIKESVLCKPDELTAEEFEHIKQHVVIGYSILSDLGPVRHLLPGILYHHENYDGTGYPDGLVGEAIPLVARILAVAEACDSMSNKRPYRDALPYRLVEETLVEGAGKQWDPKVVDAFLNCRHRIHTIRQRGVGHSLHVAIDNALELESAVLHAGADR
jgi:HD-GYP domain-containing protein (c-di-GMP phosphodiesterase class II)